MKEERPDICVASSAAGKKLLMNGHLSKWLHNTYIEHDCSDVVMYGYDQ